MAFPTAWPPRVASGRHSIRFYVTDAATAAFSGKAYMFADGAGANPFTPLPVVRPGSNTPVVVPPVPHGSGVASDNSPLPQIWAQTIRVCNDSAGALELSFDGVNVHGKLAGNTEVTYRNRFESGISVRAAGGNTFRIEAW